MHRASDGGVGDLVGKVEAVSDNRRDDAADDDDGHDGGVHYDGG